MQSIPLLRGNPCVFPGRSAGLDLSHPILSGGVGGGDGYGFSAIWSNNGNFLSLNSGKAFQRVSTTFPTAAIHSAIGPAGLIDGTTKEMKNPATQPTVVPLAITYGAIVVFTGTGDGSFCSVIGLTAGNACQFGMNGTGQKVHFFAGSAALSSFTLTLNVPYFIAASGRPSSTVNIVATNLQTGQIFTTVTTGGAFSALSAQAFLGSDQGAGHYANAYIAAAMWWPVFVSMPRMQAWAADPWAFWYPRTFASSMDWLGPQISAGPTVPPPTMQLLYI